MKSVAVRPVRHLYFEIKTKKRNSLYDSYNMSEYLSRKIRTWKYNFFLKLIRYRLYTFSEFVGFRFRIRLWEAVRSVIVP